MDNRLLKQALVKFFLGVILLGVLVFLPAWSFKYWQGWLLMGILFVPMYMATTVLFLAMPLVLAGYADYKKKVKGSFPLYGRFQYPGLASCFLCAASMTAAGTSMIVNSVLNKIMKGYF